ncbi:MAG: hypothetical protein AMJ46_07115 [Latescibacteria bacterium DG_63]|nr:MAG: hypothetical protein AMJ46_07115 [Latescibacteria bacterium DG_63]
MQVNVNDTSADWDPVVVADSTGSAWVFWMGIDSDQGDFEILFSRWTGTDWTPEERVHEDNMQSDSWPETCIGKDGIPWVVWERHRGGSSLYWDVLVSRWRESGWTEPETLFVGGGEGQTYEIACADTSLAWVVISTYVKRNGSYDKDLFFRSREEGVWSQLEHIDEPAIEDKYPDITLSDSHVPWVVWRESNGAFTLHCIHRDEAEWSESVLSMRGYGPKICFSGGEGPWIVYFDSTSNIDAGFWDGETWQLSGPLPGPLGTPTEWDYRPMISGTVDGGPVVVWPRADHDDSYRGDVYVSRWAGCWWSAEELVTEPDSELVAVDGWPDVSVGADGRVWVVWERCSSPRCKDVEIFARYSDDFLDEDWVRAFDGCWEDQTVLLEWDCPGLVYFNIYRSDGGECGGPEKAGERELLTPEPLRGVSNFHDTTAEPGRRYRYWLEVVAPTGSFGTCEEAGPVLVRTCRGAVRRGLLRVRPNPSAGEFLFGYYGGRESGIEVEVTDVSGRVVRRIAVEGVEGQALWDGRNERGKEVRPGIYLARLLVNGSQVGGTEKLVLLR